MESSEQASGIAPLTLVILGYYVHTWKLTDSTTGCTSRVDVIIDPNSIKLIMNVIKYNIVFRVYDIDVIAGTLKLDSQPCRLCSAKWTRCFGSSVLSF